MYYECHITFEVHPKISEKDVEEHSEAVTGWRFSKIDGDSVLGKGTRFYLTRNFPVKHGKRNTHIMLDLAANQLGCLPGYGVLRTKIEAVIYDSKKEIHFD